MNLIQSFLNFVLNFTQIYRQKQFIKSAQEIGTHFWKTSFVTSYAEPSRLHVPLKNFCKMKLMIQLDVKIYRFFTAQYLICEFWSLFDFRARHLTLNLSHELPSEIALVSYNFVICNSNCKNNAFEFEETKYWLDIENHVSLRRICKALESAQSLDICVLDKIPDSLRKL